MKIRCERVVAQEMVAYWWFGQFEPYSRREQIQLPVCIFPQFLQEK